MIETNSGTTAFMKPHSCLKMFLVTFIFFTVQSLPDSRSAPPTVPHPIPPTPSLRGCPRQASVLPGASFLKLGASSPTEARPGSPLLYICWDLGLAHVCCLVGGSVSERTQGFRLIETVVGLAMGLPSSSSASSSLSPNSTAGVSDFSLMVGCNYLLLSQSAACWASLRVVSVLGASPWAGSKFGPATEPLFLQSVLHFCPCSSFRQGRSGSEFLIVGWQPHPSTWCPAFLLEVDSISSLSPLLGISFKVPPFEFWESFTSQVSEGPPIWGGWFLFFSAGSQSFTPDSPLPQYLIMFPFSSPCPLSHPGPSFCPPPPNAFYPSPPSGIEDLGLWLVNLLEFCILGILYFFG
jgi:hypothetical protein